MTACSGLSQVTNDCLLRSGSQFSFWVSQRMSVGRSHVPVTKKGTATEQSQAHEESALSIRQAGINNLIRQRMQQEMSTPHEPHHTLWTDDCHSSQSGVCNDLQIRDEEGDEQSPNDEQRSMLRSSQSREGSVSLSESPAPSPSSLPAASDTDQHRQTDCYSEADVKSSMSGSDAAVCQQHPTQASYQSDALPRLLDRPNHAVCYESIALTPGHGPTSCESSGHSLKQVQSSLVNPSKRLCHAAPTYVGTMLAQQEAVQSQAHSQLPMPFSHLLCLWAIKLVLPHPVSQKSLKLSIPDPPVFEQIRVSEAHLANPRVSR